MGFLHPYRERSLPELILETQAEGDGPALAEILRRFEPLTSSLGRRMAEGRTYREDVEAAARFALVRATARHRADGDTFPAYAKRYMSGAALRELQRWSLPTGWSHCQLDSIDPAALRRGPAVDEQTDHGAFGNGRLAQLIQQLRPAQQHLLAERYVEDAALADLAAERAISVSAVSQRLDTVHRAIEKGLAA